NERKIRLTFKEDIEPHEILLDSLAKRREEGPGVSEKKLEVPLYRTILQGFFFLCFLVLLLLFAKTFQFQVIEGKKFGELSQENRYIVSQIEAARGVIYDRGLNQLVFNLPSFDLIVRPSRLPEEKREEILREVSEIIGKDYEVLKEEIEGSGANEVLVAENISHELLLLLETKIKELPGFEIENNTIRNYFEGEVFPHLMGYTGRITAEEFKEGEGLYSIADFVGRTGIENYYEEILRKRPGQLRIERDALDNVISKEIVSLPQSGDSLVLWLDAGLQEKIKEELEAVLSGIGSKKAAAIALDPKTGGVLAMVSLPSFDNNLFQGGRDPQALSRILKDPNQALLNRAVSGRYLTGSTIKPLIASAALQENLISPDKKIYDDKGFIEVPHRYDPEIIYQYEDWTVHGWTDMRKAIAESCNVYFYTIGGGYGSQEGLGPTKIKKYLELFGWGERTGIDLPGEAKGFIPSKEWKEEVFGEGWWDGNTYYLSIGQEYLQITPLEVVTAFAAIANGGKLMQPQVVEKIVDKEKNVLETFQPKVTRENFIDSENLQVVREGMRQAVTGVNSPQASAVILNSLPVSAAAKTGTAELGNDRYNNWITVFAPYDDPEIVLTLIVEDIKGVQAAVLPVAYGVLNWYFTKP
ncbi:MAG: penicillin-binding protein 2, partial [bacterium]|nr:penicillin-binding protein 2 [bacterium]